MISQQSVLLINVKQQSSGISIQGCLFITPSSGNCRRTADIIDQVKEDGHSDYIQESSGLIPDAYFSASKIKWILDHVPGARTAAARGDVALALSIAGCSGN